MAKDTLNRQDLITLITAIVLGQTGESLKPEAIGSNAILTVDGIRIE